MFLIHSDDSDESAPKSMDLSDCDPFRPGLPSQRVSKSATTTCSSSQSDSSTTAGARFRTRKSKNTTGFVRELPPLGLFWDIENVRVPKMKNASVVVQKLREVFLENYRESEFVVVCDVKKENPQIVQELHDSQVDLLHVSSSSKNAADEKLRQSLRRYAELHPAPSAVVLISGDINFAGDLSDLRYRKKIRVILVHNVNVADALILCANEHHSFTELTENLPVARKLKDAGATFYLSVLNIPKNVDPVRVKTRLQNLTYNCGGKCVQFVTAEGVACLRFGNFDLALRAQKRIQGEDVFGNKIKVLSPSVRCYVGKKVKSVDQSASHNAAAPPPPPPGFDLETEGGLRDWPQRQASASRGDAGKPILGRPRTPQEPLFKRVHTFSGSSNHSDGGFRPVDLNITNLDPAIEANELRKLLTSMIKEYATILSISVSVQADGTSVASLRVGSQQEAQFVISKLHRQKLGHKRITVSYAQSNQPAPDQLKAMTISILQEVPDQSMPLFKFMELLESRFHCTVSVSDVNRLKNVARIADKLGSRVIYLTQEVRVSPPPSLSRTMVPFCTVHCPNGLRGSRGWCEEFGSSQVPNVTVSLADFASALKRLLDSHLGSVPLLSFQACYEQEFRAALPVDEEGVPLEHLVTCVADAELLWAGPNRNIKIVAARGPLRRETGVDEGVAAAPKTVATPLAPNVNLLCRELVDLLKTTDRCQLALTKFIPAYHHHFGRQCRVADYGFTKLLDLFESVSNVVQIMGDGTRRVITLTHPAQMRRFTSDLLRVLKVQPAKQILAVDFAPAYEKVMGRPFNPVEYGLCTFVDLLREMAEHTLVLNQTRDGLMIAVPKREQTAEEAARTKQFAKEVIDLLQHTPYYTMLFNKFVPAYHHHFGHQCRVSDYGFGKLIELFEAIPHVVKVEELPDGERTVSLTERESLKILGEQVRLLAGQWNHLPINELAPRYLREYGYPLKPTAYGCESVADLLSRLLDYVEFVDGNTIRAAPRIKEIVRVRCWSLLLDPPHCKELAVLRAEYGRFFGGRLSRDALAEISDVASTSSTAGGVEYVSLTAVYTLAAQIYHVICTNGGSVDYNQLERLYGAAYGKPLKLSVYQIRCPFGFLNRLGVLFNLGPNYPLKPVVSLNSVLEEYYLKPVLSARQAKKFSPPKPDTPPTPETSSSSSWNRWSVPGKPASDSSNLSINMPITHNPTLLGDTQHLVSPARHLLLAEPWRRSPPHPSELPLPDKFIAAPPAPTCTDEGACDESADSGVNIRLDNSDNEHEPPTGRTGAWCSYLDFH